MKRKRLLRTLRRKMKFSIKDFLVNGQNQNFPVDLVKFTEEALNRKLHFLCSWLFCH